MSFDSEDLYIEYQTKVNLGEIDPKKVSVGDYVRQAAKGIMEADIVLDGIGHHD